MNKDLPTSQYRVWCLQQLRQQFQQLPEAVQSKVQQHLQATQCWQPLWRLPNPESNYDTEQQAPFNKGIKVYPFKATQQ